MLSTMHTSITTSRIIHRVLSVMATMLNASVEPMPVMVTTQMITPMAAQAMVTWIEPRAASFKASAIFSASCAPNCRG